MAIKQKQRRNRAPLAVLKNDLRRARLARNLSRRQVGRMLGLSSSVLSAYERAVSAPSLKVALSLQILYREQLAGLYAPLYAFLVKQIRAAEGQSLDFEESGKACE